MGAYEMVLPVRFGQVDYAGIMYYPRFFENFHTVFEDMFSKKLGVPYMSILKERRVGFPMVHIETDFKRPFRFGEPMRLLLDVTRIGRSSITFRYRGFNGPATEVSVEALGIVVVTHLDTFETLEIPPDIQAVLEDLRAIVPAALVLVAVASVAACSHAPPPPQHVLLIVIDATHASQLSSYGGPAGLTPALDALAARGVRFERAHSAAAWTLPATASLLTGQVPEHHGVVTEKQSLPDTATTLADLFDAAGWSTAAFVQMVYASDSYHLDQGFSHYRFYASDAEKRDDLLVYDAAAWMEAHAAERTFTYVHFRRPHGPYDPLPEAWRRLGPPPEMPPEKRFYELQHADSEITDVSQLQPGEQQFIERLYRANIATVDGSIASLLLRVPDPDRTLVIVTADHGEALGEHGRFGHGAHVWAETVDIPLIVAGPGLPPHTDAGPAGTTDVLPTLLEACALPRPAGLALDGVSLWPRLTGREPDPGATAESPAVAICSRYGGPSPPTVAVIEGRWKLLLPPDDDIALYDRATDHEDRVRLETSQPDVTVRLRAVAERWRDEHRDAAQAALPAPVLPADRQEQLKQLGYVR